MCVAHGRRVAGIGAHPGGLAPVCVWFHSVSSAAGPCGGRVAPCLHRGECWSFGGGQGAILQRNCTDVRDVPTLRALLQEHETNAPVTAPLVEMDSLEDDAFSLLLKKLDYDLQALRVAKVRRTKVLYSTLIHP